jgi:uncharacterized protein YkwD
MWRRPTRMYYNRLKRRNAHVAVNLALSAMLALAPAAVAAPEAIPPVAPAIKRAGTPAGGTAQQPVVAPVGSTGTGTAATPAAKPSTMIDRDSIQRSAQVAELEKVMFGAPATSGTIEERLTKLETEVFHKTNASWTTAERIRNLTEMLIGSGSQTAPYPPTGGTPTAVGAPYSPQQQPPGYDPRFGMPNQQVDPYAPQYGYQPQPDPYAMQADPQQQQPAQPTQRAYAEPPAPKLDSHDFQRELPRAEAEKYALEWLNEIRAFNGLPHVKWDETAHKVAQHHVADLCARSTVSHNSKAGENPDVRYTKAGGTDAMLEGLISMKTSGRVKFSKAVVYQMLKELMKTQDDRDALLSPYATQFAFSLDNNSRNDKMIACSEVVTDVGELDPIPVEVKVGDKIDVKGTLKAPYRFAKITVAWEGLNGNPEATAEEEQEEALPYFPPLDYTAYAQKTERDWEKTTRALQLVGLAAVLAGSLFVPPVALAAPLIATAGPNPAKMKPASDIPIKGGVKVSGQSFEHKTTISKDNKEGIYYITVWAETDTDQTPIAISRRAVIARALEQDNLSAKENRELLTVVEKEQTTTESRAEQPKKEKKAKKRKKDKEANEEK